MKTRKELKKLYNTLEFQKEYQYDKKDLGALCTEEGTSFLLWSPLAEEVELRLYRDGKHSECFQKIAMQKEQRESGATRQRDICMAFIMIIKSRGTEK